MRRRLAIPFSLVSLLIGVSPCWLLAGLLRSLVFRFRSSLARSFPMWDDEDLEGLVIASLVVSACAIDFMYCKFVRHSVDSSMSSFGCGSL